MEMLKPIVVLIFVLGLILALWILLKKFGIKNIGLIENNIKVSFRYIDNKNKLAVIDYENKKYIVLLSNNNVLLDTIEK